MPQSSQTSPHVKTSIVLWILSAVISVCAFSVAMVSAHGSLASAWRNATTRQPENFSALYFDQPARLPSYSPAKKQQTIHYSIVNHEHQTITYHVETEITMQNITTAHDTDFTLTDGQTAAETLTYIIPKPNEPAFIVIKLVGTDQLLTFRASS